MSGDSRRARCLDDGEVAALVGGEAPNEELARAAEHAADCDACRELLACIGRVRAAEARGLTEPSVDLERSLSDIHAPTRTRAGARLGRYRLGGEIGRGGMGIVLEAHDPELDRRVAIKVLHEHSDLQRLARMAREAQAVAALSHPNVVQVFDVSLGTDPAFIVMEFVDGSTLREWIAEHRPDWRTVLGAYLQAAHGLAAAHAVGLVHRDFKPGNAMIDADGRVSVLDFGLARPDADGSSWISGEPSIPLSSATLTATGTAIGTPLYMAPEQHRGERVDARADVYGLGVALYEGLYGKLPFEARTMELLLVLKERGIDPEPPDASIPGPIHAAIRKALAYDPEQRWPTMSAFIDALVLPPRRRRATWLLAGLAAVGLVAAVLVHDHAPPGLVDPPTTTLAASQHHALPVDPALAIEAAQLIVAAGVQHEAATPDRGLGTALAAVTVAAGSGSPRLLACAEMRVGAALTGTWRAEAALPWLDAGIERARVAGDDRAAAEGMLTSIDALGRLGQYEQALDAGRQARALAERVGDDGSLLLEILATEAAALPSGYAGEPERQEQVMTMLSADTELADPRVRAMALNNLAAMVANADPERGRKLLTEAFEIRQRVLGPDHPDTLATTVNLAWTDYVTSDYRECVARASTAYERSGPADLELRAGAADAVASCLWLLHDVDQGLVWIDRALEAQAALDPEAESNAGKLETKAQLLSARNEWEQTEAVLQRALIIREAAASGPSSATATTRSFLAWAARERSAIDRAEAYARASVAEYEAVGDHERIPHARILHARILLDAGRATEAMAVLADEVDASPPSDPVTAAAAKGTNARALWISGSDREHAVELAREALEALAGSDVYGEVRDELRAFIASAP